MFDYNDLSVHKPIKIMAMESEYLAEKLIDLFDSAYHQGYDVNDPVIQERVFKMADCTPNDLFEYDLKRVIREVEYRCR